MGSDTPAGSGGALPRVWRSTDGGLSWSQPIAIGDVVGFATSVVRVAGQWVVAVGGHEGVYVVTSADGLQWTRPNLPIAPSPDIPFVARVQSGVVLVADLGVWFESIDGLSWQSRSLDFGPKAGLGAVVGSTTGTIVVGEVRGEPAAWRVDGDRVVMATVDPLPGVSEGRLSAVAVSSDRAYVAVSRNGASSLDGASAWTSADGATWHVASAAIPSSRGGFDIEDTPLGLIAVGIGGGGVYQSSDGTDWKDVVPVLGNATIAGLTPTSDGFVAVGEQTTHGPWFAMLAPLTP